MKLLRLIFAVLALPALALAHSDSHSYLKLTLHGRELAGQLDLSLKDLDVQMGLDASGDGRITWGELKARGGEIASYVRKGLSLSLDGATCPLEIEKQLVDQHLDGAYVVIFFRGACAAGAEKPAKVAVDYGLLFDTNLRHKVFLSMEAEGVSEVGLLSLEQQHREFVLGASALADGAKRLLTFVQEGIWHIWTGFDHVLFLLALLLPCVFETVSGRIQPAQSLRKVLAEVLRVVTAFTVAHSVTLTLAALAIIRPPTRFVESTIAASVVLAAANNLKPFLGERRWFFAFAFGLIHGFGFAGVLTDLSLPQSSILVPLLGFNLGVEIGQLAIVATFVPLAYAARRTWTYENLAFRLGSVTTGAIAAIWFMERAFSFSPFGPL